MSNRIRLPQILSLLALGASVVAAPAFASREDTGTPIPPGRYVSVLKEKSDFLRYLAHWRVECEEHSILKTDPFFGVRLRDFAEDTLYMGLIRLREVNPELVNKALSRVHLPMVIRCPREPSNGDEFGDNPRGLSVLFPKKGSVVGRFLKQAEAALSVACSYGALCRNPKTRPVEEYRQPLFQEFLHAFKLENVRRRIPDPHTSPNDVISACSCTVFPSGLYPVGEEGAPPNIVRVLSTQEACEFCARAQPKERGITEVLDLGHATTLTNPACAGARVVR